MTDPIQQTNPWQANPQQQQGQQQGSQQWYTDDILWWEDIFATIPEIEEDLPYGDMLEKKYQQQPVQEEEIPVVAPQAPVQQPVRTVPEVVLEPIAEQEIATINQQAWVEQAQVNTLLDTQLQTDVQKKFGELFFTTKRIYDLKDKVGISEETFDVLGADNDKIFISYRFLLDDTSDPMVVITKIEQNKDTQEETENELRFTFNQESLSLEVMVNDIVLFDEIQDFTEDAKKKMQVSEKLNKFIFLASEEQRKMEKEIQAKEEEEREKRKLQDIFRNF